MPGFGNSDIEDDGEEALPTTTITTGERSLNTDDGGGGIILGDAVVGLCAR